MQVQFLYGSKIKNREQLHEQLAQIFRFPAHYGKNLDALWDCLGDVSAPFQLIITERDVLSANLGDYCGKFLRVLEDTKAENPNLHIEYR